MRRRSCGSSSRSTRTSAPRTVFSIEVLDERPGFLSFAVAGARAEELFAMEAGGHRWQRVPPNDRRGRRHTSTVTVAVLPLAAELENALDPREVEWKAVVGSGPGGQHRNRTASAIDMRHLPTGICVHVETERSQAQNRALAMQILAGRVAQASAEEFRKGRDSERRLQVGSGQRGDKVRTVRMQDGVVTDHRTGRKMPFSRYRRGELEPLIR